MTSLRHPYLDHPVTIPFAHRGGAADGIENTTAAFRRAAEAGYRYFETDVHTTSDGRLVAFHDTTLDRVTDARGRIADLPWSEVRQARVAGREPLPLFEELLEEFPDARWNVDIKAEPALVPLIDLIRRTDAWDRVCVGSFSETRVARAHRLAGPGSPPRTVSAASSACGCARTAYRLRCAPERCARRFRRARTESGWSTGASSGRPMRADSRSMSGR